MQTPPAQQVIFTYVGALQTRGRLLKQVATLQSAGVRCEVVLGNTQDQPPTSGDHPFSITAIPVNIRAGKLRSFVEVFKFAWQAGRLIARSKADTVVSISIESILAGTVAKLLRPSIRLVFDNNELQIESFESRLKRWIWLPLHNAAVRRCDVILHAEPNRMAYFKQHYPGRDKPQVVIENFPFFVERQPPSKDLADGIRVIYLGGFGAGRYTFEIIDAFARQPDNRHLDIVGFGTDDYVAKVKERIAATGNPRIRILPPVPYLAIARLLEDYHIGLAFYKNTDLNNYYCAPNKVYDYLMNGMPVIANAYPGLLAVLEANAIGVCVEEVDADRICAAITRIIDGKLWQNITPEVRRRFSWEQQRRQYLAVFGHAASPESI